MADLSEDAVLIEAFQSGRDFHSITAARVFDVPADDVTPGQRAKIKAMNYGLAYGLSAFGLGAQLRIHPSEAQVLMDEYFETFGGVRDYLSSVVDEARRTRLHRDHPRPPPLPARPHLRQPPAPRDGRADGPQRPHPGLRRRPDQGGDAARARGDQSRPGCGRGCCSRSTTSSSSRSSPASARRSRRWSASRWAAPRQLEGPPRRLHRHRPQLARSRALTHRHRVAVRRRVTRSTTAGDSADGAATSPLRAGVPRRSRAGGGGGG